MFRTFCDYIKFSNALDLHPPGGCIERVPVIVTNGWLRTAYNVLESLGKRGIPVHVVDASRYAMCRVSRWTKSFHLVPSHYDNPEAFVRAVAKVAAKVGAKVLIPIHEEFLSIARFRHLLPPALKLALTTVENLEIGFSKLRTIELCQQVGVPVPLTFTPKSTDDLSGLSNDIKYPAVIKPRIGNSAKGVLIVHDEEQFLRSYENLLDLYNFKDGHWPIVQEYLGKDLHGVSMIYENGRLRASFSEQYIRCKEDNMFGTSTYRMSTHRPHLIAACKQVADYLGWHGVIEFDMLIDSETGVGKIIEINPRFWGALNLAITSGMDFPYMLYELALIGEIQHPPVTYLQGITSRWVMGDMIAIVNTLLGSSDFHSKLRRISSIMTTPLHSPMDDLRVVDPAPFLWEMIDYAIRYLSSGSRNPVLEGMIR